MQTNDVQKLYIAYYGRPGDFNGLQFWCDATRDGVLDIDLVLDSFGESDEYQNWLTTIDFTPATLINQLYLRMFNREAETEGLAFYGNLLESGDKSLASIALDIANGAKNKDLIALTHKIEVANQFIQAVVEDGNFFSEYYIEDAQNLLSGVDHTEESIAAANEPLQVLVAKIASDQYDTSLALTWPPCGDIAVDELVLTPALDTPDYLLL